MHPATLAALERIGWCAARDVALGPGVPDEPMRKTLASLTPESLFGGPVRRPEFAKACLAGLWLWHDFLDESHEISQTLATPEGSFWHAIMHRREPDAWNSKYWWRRVGSHPVLGQLREQASAIGYAYSQAERFVDFVEQVRGADSSDERLAQRVQALEWTLLFDHCWKAAV